MLLKKYIKASPSTNMLLYILDFLGHVHGWDIIRK